MQLLSKWKQSLVMGEEQFEKSLTSIHGYFLLVAGSAVVFIVLLVNCVCAKGKVERFVSYAHRILLSCKLFSKYAMNKYLNPPAIELFLNFPSTEMNPSLKM